MAPLFDASLPEPVKQAVRDKIAKRLDWTATALKGRSYTLGETFSVADGYLFTVLSWTRGVGLDLKRWPVLAAFQERVAARPAVQAAMRAEGLVR
jgi:glutathione S-transferase